VIDISDQSALPDIIDQLSSGDIVVFNKTDLIDGASSLQNVSRETFTALQLSAKDGERGIAALRSALESIIAQRYSVREDAGLTRARHRDCVSRAKEALTNARQNLDIAPELSGEDMRRALHAIKELAGEADIEAVLDRIFSRFCIGK
jgi:tRNA modification GTPase